MAEVRQSWFDKRYRTSGAVREAEKQVARMGALGGRIFSMADALAGSSVHAAQSFFLASPRTVEALGASGLERWFDLGRRMLESRDGARGCGRIFFSISPADLPAPALERVEAWAAAAARLSAVSPRLAERLLGAMRPLLDRDDLMERLPRWEAAARELHGSFGWKGETLARAYLDSALPGFTAIDPENYRLWGGVAGALWSVVRPHVLLPEVANLVAVWSAPEQRALFRAAISMAGSHPREALLLIRRLPRALSRLEPAERSNALCVFALAAPACAVDAAALAPVAGALVRSVPAAERSRILERIGSLAQEQPRASLRALRALPYLFEQAPPDRVHRWFDTGLALTAENPEKGAAFFGLESRTSVRVLDQQSTAASIEELQGLLRKYIQMLSGVAVSLHGIVSAGLRPPLEEFPAENEVTLPLRIDHLATVEDNQRLYLLLASQLAARHLYGTYSFGTGANEAPEGHPLRRHLDRADQPAALEEIFLLAESVRLHHRLAGAYPGIRKTARELGSALLRRWRSIRVVTLDRVLDALLAFTWAEGREPLPPWLPADLARIAIVAFAPLASPEATVEDSMAVAEHLARRLAERARMDASREADTPVDPDSVDTELPVEPWLQDADEEGLAAAGDAEREDIPGAEDAEPAAVEGSFETVPAEDPPGGQPLDPEEIRRLLESGARLRIAEGDPDHAGQGVGVYLDDLVDRLPRAEIERLRRLLADSERRRARAVKAWTERGARGQCFYYDEWDYHIGDYRARWCRLYEIGSESDSGEFFQAALEKYGRLIPEVRRQFQRLRPESYRKVRGLEDGEDFDLNAVIDAHADRKARRTPSAKVYMARKREARDVATLFLLDMSASTDEPVDGSGPSRDRGGRRVIDVTKEALVVMAAALEEIGDAYAIYGFSGHGRSQVEFYLVKSFAEPLNPAVRGRIGGVRPRRSTRMGPAIRHAVEKFSAVHTPSKNLLLISDGFPQDHDYGPDRRSNIYGLRDTMMALREAEAAGIAPFCITVDRAGRDYLREMCDESRYMVIDEIERLPLELPKIYRRVVRRDELSPGGPSRPGGGEERA